jgi:hypothetical protein
MNSWKEYILTLEDYRYLYNRGPESFELKGHKELISIYPVRLWYYLACSLSTYTEEDVEEEMKEGKIKLFKVI